MKLIYLTSFLLFTLIYCDDYVDLDDEFCYTEVCLLDAKRLTEGMSNESLAPCVDFKEFSVGALIENHHQKGFLFDSANFYRARHRNMLLSPIEEHDHGVVKIAKNFYHKCVDEEYILTEGYREISAYVKDKGFPLAEGSDWQPVNVNLTNLLYDPATRLEYFFTHKIGRCVNPQDADFDIYCLKYSHAADQFHRSVVENRDKYREVFFNLLKNANFMLADDVDIILHESIDQLFLFLEEKIQSFNPEWEKFDYIVKIKDIKQLTPISNLDIDWLMIVNREFFNHSKAYSNDENILIEDWQTFSKSMEIIENTDLRAIMDIFLLFFLYDNQHVYVDNFDKQDMCLDFLQKNFAPVLIFQFSKEYLTREHIKVIKNYVDEAVFDIERKLFEDRSINVFLLLDAMRKFKKLKTIIGGVKELFDDQSMDQIYYELSSLENEGSILDISNKLTHFNNKINNEPNEVWFHQAAHFSNVKSIKYFPDDDLLFIPMEYTQYPFFDPDRPRFFNTASFYTEIAVALNEGIRKFSKTDFYTNYVFQYDSIELGFKNYQRWEEINFLNEKKLPGFLLTNLQMYFLAFAHAYYIKNRINLPYKPHDILDLQLEYFDVWFKARQEFRETFNCDDLTAEEEQRLNELIDKFNKI